MKIVIINGPNLNLLGKREPAIYGIRSMEQVLVDIQRAHMDVHFTYLQSNHEGVIVDTIQQAWGVYDGIVINPAAYTHTSVAILDAVKSVSIPTVEVHISKVEEREDFRQVSYIRAACIGTVSGQGTDGYLQAIALLEEHYES